MLDSEHDEEGRLKRMEQIHEQANNERLARCEAKKKEVGEAKFMELLESGDWSDHEGMTEIEKEYWRLWNEQFHLNWYRDHGKPYRIEDDPNAQF